MGAGGSIEAELQKPADASDVATPRGESAKREVVRLRALLDAQRAAEAAATGLGATPPGTGFDLSEESYDKDFCQVFDGVWSVCTAHNPGNVAAMPKHNNRCWVIKLADADGGGDFLCVYGIPECALAAPKIRAVEQATGLQVRWFMGSGCWHHLYLKHWFEAFPDPAIKFFMTDAKFPGTRNGQALLAEDSPTRDRIVLWNGTEVPPAAAKYADQVQFLCNDQLTTYPDAGPSAGGPDLVPPEKTQDLIAWMGATGCTCRFAAVSMYHVASKTLSIDHNFDMFQPGEDWDKQPPMMQAWHPRHTLQSGVFAGMRVVDPKINVAQIKAMLALDVRLLVDLHANPTRIVWGYATKDAYVEHLTAVWTKSGELDETGKALPQNASAKAEADAAPAEAETNAE